MSRFIDLTGGRFGRLIVIKRVDNGKQGNPTWLCRCDCGKEKVIRGNDLKTGHTKSCGCLKIKHGHNTRAKGVSKTYKSWYAMIQRCTNPNDKAYHNYGGRGVKVCQRWKKFKNFLKDMGEVSEGYQIDRIDNNKGYDKSNCRWVTSKQNSRNKRDNHLETYNGKTQCVSAWAEEFDIHERTLNDRLHRGLSIKEALTTPVKKRRKLNEV